MDYGTIANRVVLYTALVLPSLHLRPRPYLCCLHARIRFQPQDGRFHDAARRRKLPGDGELALVDRTSAGLVNGIYSIGTGGEVAKRNRGRTARGGGYEAFVGGDVSQVDFVTLSGKATDDLDACRTVVLATTAFPAHLVKHNGGGRRAGVLIVGYAVCIQVAAEVDGSGYVYSGATAGAALIIAAHHNIDAAGVATVGRQQGGGVKNVSVIARARRGVKIGDDVLQLPGLVTAEKLQRTVAAGVELGGAFVEPGGPQATVIDVKAPAVSKSGLVLPVGGVKLQNDRSVDD